MKLADDALLMIIEYLRQALLEEKDISNLLKEMELEPDGEGKLRLKRPAQSVEG